MKEFSSFAGFATHLAELIVKQDVVAQATMNKVGSIIEKAAKEKIGEYQPQAGQFVAWAELADSTKSDRVAQGYPEDEPLLRDGAMRDSIEHNASPTEAHIGSNSDIAVYQELGTDTIPPRSFLAGAAFEQEKKVVELIGGAVTSWLVGEDVVNKKLRIE